MIVQLLTEHHLELLRLKGGCTGCSQSTHVKMPHCRKSHAAAHIKVLSKQCLVFWVYITEYSICICTRVHADVYSRDRGLNGLDLHRHLHFVNVLILTLKAPITTKVVCFSRLLNCLRSLYGKQYGPRSDCSIGAVCSGSTLFASILNLSVMLGIYLQQTTSADDIFRCIFFFAL